MIAQNRGIDGYRPPVDEPQAFLLEGLGDDRPGSRCLDRWHEAHHEPESIRIYGTPVSLQFAVDQLIRDLGQQPGSVPRPVGCLGSSMVEVLQTFDGQASHSKGRHPIACSDETNATCVVLEDRIGDRLGHRAPRSGATQCKACRSL